MNKKYFILKVFIVLIISHQLHAQTYYSPISGITASNFSSAYGPRNYNPNATTEEYPYAGYNYDFHAGMDITSPHGTNVYPVCDGKVTDYGTGTNPDYYWIEVQHTSRWIR